ncbi:MAG: MBL fold metallo-hydrolase [Clostridia bacterium]|nr:MBL fold metallo-hydrolase [Clostridia bacterium]
MKNFCRIVNLYSGSGGNSTFIRVGDHAILIDAGKSARALCKALCEIGEDIENINAIFITHEHSDHVSALEVLSKKHAIPIHITEQSAEIFDGQITPYCFSRLFIHPVEFCEQIGDMSIRSFRTPHDSRMSVGYRIEFCDGEHKRAIGYATDIGYVSDDIRKNLTGCDAVIIESNHDTEMLKNGPYPAELKARVASKRGHLSNCECSEFAIDLAQSGTRAFLLAHLSKENNEPCLALETTERALSGLGVRVLTANPDAPCELNFSCEEDGDCVEREVYNPWNA